MPDTETDVDDVKIDPIPVLDAAPAGGPKPKYLRIGDQFYAQTDQGEICITMRWPTKQMRAMPREIALGELLDQVYYLCAADKRLIAKIDELDIMDSRELARKMFQAYTEWQRARLGESSSSSIS